MLQRSIIIFHHLKMICGLMKSPTKWHRPSALLHDAVSPRPPYSRATDLKTNAPSSLAQTPVTPVRGLGFHQACLGASMALVGSYVALSQSLVLVFGVTLLAWLRFLIGAAAMPHWLRKPADEPPMEAAVKGLLFIESLLGNVLFSLCMLAGIARTSAVSAGVILSFIPLAVALLGWLFLRERVAPRTWVAIALAIVGMGLLHWDTARSVEQRHDSWLGNLLILGAVLCEASYAVIGKRLSATLGPRRITSLINLWGLALMTPLAWSSLVAFEPARIEAQQWGLLVFYALAASVWTVWLWMTGLQRVPASRAGVFTAFLPVSACLVGWAMGEQPSALQWVALGLSLVGVWVCASEKKQHSE